MPDHGAGLGGVWNELDEHDRRLGTLEGECRQRFAELARLVNLEDRAELRRQWEAERRAELRRERAVYFTTAQKLAALALALIGVADFVAGLIHQHG